MNTKIKELLRASGIHHDTHLVINYNAENTKLEDFLKLVVYECFETLSEQYENLDLAPLVRKFDITQNIIHHKKE